MKIKKNEIMFLLAFLGGLVAVVVYVWVYLPTNEKTAALEAENTENAKYVAQLEEWEQQVDVFQKETAQMIVDVNEIFAHFPSESRAEDAIMYAVDLEGQDEDTYISSIGLSQAELIYEAAPTTVKLNDADEGNEKVYRLYNQSVSFTQEFTYDGMKRYVQTIVNDNNSRTIESMNLAYDSATGILVGSTDINLFTITGTDKAYQDTWIPSMQMGTDNIFGTIELNNANEENEE